MTGPWIVERYNDRYVVSKSGSPLIFLSRRTQELAQKACDEANERHRLDLIREAAPEMFQLLKDLYNYGYVNFEDHDRVAAVIAKAEGRSTPTADIETSPPPKETRP